MSQPEIAILVSTFERPRHLARVLASIAAQNGVAGAVEVVVTDDGSRDHTPRLVRDFASAVRFPVHFTTHRHAGFHIARCRNEGVAAATAPYLLFLDGDCIIPPDHIKRHLEHRAAGYALAGYPIYLTEPISNKITEQDVAQAAYLRHVTAAECCAMRWRHVRGLFARLVGDLQRPKLLGGNLGIARSDYECINGYDENFRGWGCEDDDLRLRLRSAGVQVASIAWWTNTYHLWHPKTPTAPATWREGANIAYFRRPLRLTRCIAGLKRRRLQDLHIGLVGRRPPESLLKLLPAWCRVAASTLTRSHGDQPEIEIAFAGASDHFSRRANCRVLIAADSSVPARELTSTADIVFTAHPLAEIPQERQFPLRDFDRIMQWQLGHLQTLAFKSAAAA